MNRLSSLVLLAVAALLSMGLAALLAGIAWRRRGSAADEPQPEAGQEDEARWRGRVRVLGGLLKPEAGPELEELKSRAVRAGLYGDNAINLFLTARLISLTLGIVILVVSISAVKTMLVAMLVSIATIAAAVLGPSLWLDLRIRRRQSTFREALPGMLHLLVICLDAGLSLRSALERVIGERDEMARDTLLIRELRLALADVQVGVTIETAFKRLAARIGSEEARMLAIVISKASTLGGRVADLLRGHARILRQKQMADLEERSGKASAKMTLPLTLCLLPSMLIVIAGPVFITLFNVL